MNKERCLKLEFAVLLAVSLFALWQMGAFVWRSLAAWL
jgi:hypothetical protein